MKKRQLRNLIVFSSFTVVFIGLLGLILYFERDAPNGSIKSFFDAFWYSIVTLTTVGYGDLYPVTLPGKIVGLVIILLSLGLLSYIISQISQYIHAYMEKKKLGHFGTKFSNHVILIGWNSIAKMIADQIIQANQEVAVITDDRNHLDLIHELYDDDQVFAVFGDMQSDDALRKANISKASSVLINTGKDSDSLVYLINFRKKFRSTSAVVSLQNHELKDTFYSAGATYVVSEREISTKLIASFVFEPDVAKFTEDLMTTATDDHSYDMLEFLVTDQNPYAGKPYMDAFVELKQKLNAVLIGISKKEGNDYKLFKNPAEEMRIGVDDYLILVTNGHGKKEIETQFGVKEGRMVCTTAN